MDKDIFKEREGSLEEEYFTSRHPASPRRVERGEDKDPTFGERALRGLAG